MMMHTTRSLRYPAAGAARPLRLKVSAKMGRPEPQQQPDPFDRHSSPRDKQRAQQSQQQPGSTPKSQKGKMFETTNRRRGRPSHLRSPNDSPMRDGNRDRLIGLLTERAAKTLMVYLGETNPTMYHWLFNYYMKNPIPLQGNWDEVSGEAFLRKMLSTPIEVAKMDLGRDKLFDNIAATGVDPREMAQRIMDIRVQLSKEFVQELSTIADENQALLRETLQASMDNALQSEPVEALLPGTAPTKQVFVHPELLTGNGTLHPEVARTHPELLKAISPPPEDKPTTTATATPTPASISASAATAASGNSNGSAAQPAAAAALAPVVPAPAAAPSSASKSEAGPKKSVRVGKDSMDLEDLPDQVSEEPAAPAASETPVVQQPAGQQPQQPQQPGGTVV